MAVFVRHETRALLRAHLQAASGYRHLTRHCPICHRLQNLAMAMELASDDADCPEGLAEDESPASA
ncbi:DUF6274 family protein [Streptomyces sp. CA-288835]|uniref:DUF6274 family protein n=1 Tax=Streptomyces sp. CA-288835 TaxID=3240069 RepID=UPI003D93CA1C